MVSPTEPRRRPQAWEQDGKKLTQAFASKWHATKFACLGAAHLDTITRLVEPAVRNRTNPVHAPTVRPGGVANNIACCLARLGAKVTLHCPPPPAVTSRQLRQLGIQRRNIGQRHHSCGYTAILKPDGELELGLADMEEYDRMGANLLPASFPGPGPGVLVLDAAFAPALMRAAAKQARAKDWQVVGAATSPAKVGRLRNIPFSLFVLNEAEARAFAGAGTAKTLATRIAKRTKGWVAITQGNKGACLATAGTTLQQHPPHCAITDTTGAGDAFTATLAAAKTVVDQGYFSPAEALCLAVAMGSAATSSQIGGRP